MDYLAPGTRVCVLAPSPRISPTEAQLEAEGSRNGCERRMGLAALTVIRFAPYEGSLIMQAPIPTSRER